VRPVSWRHLVVLDTGPAPAQDDHLVLSNETFDSLIAELEEPARCVPELMRLFRWPSISPGALTKAPYAVLSSVK